MKRGLSKISIMILGTMLVIVVLAIIVYQGLYANKVVLFNNLTNFSKNVAQKIEKYKVKEIISSDFSIKTEVNETSNENIKFLKENNNIEGKLDLNRENMEFSLKLNLKDKEREKDKIHYINKELVEYITLYKKSGDKYIKKEKNDLYKLLIALSNTSSKEQNIEKVFKRVIKEVPNKSIYIEDAKVKLEEKEINTKRYILSLTSTELEQVIMNSMKNIREDKKLLLELDTVFLKSLSGKAKAENVISNAEEELRIFANSLNELKVILDLDENNNIVNIETLVKDVNKKDKNLKVTMLQAKNVEFSLIYKEANETIFTFLNKKLDASQYNATICYKDVICNTLIKKEQLITVDYSLKSKKTDNPYGIGTLIITNEKEKYNVLLKYDGNIEDEKLNLKVDMNGTKKKVDKLDDFEKGFGFKETISLDKKELLKLITTK